MELMTWRPFRELALFRREMNRLFDRFFMERPETELSEGKWSPSLDISETKDALVINAEIPGINPDDINISIIDNVLTIKGEKKEEKEEKEENCYCKEICCGSFSRSVRLPVSVKTEDINASYKNGILKIVLPKKEEAKPKKIEVKVG